jgi:hypothetical protein
MAGDPTDTFDDVPLAAQYRDMRSTARGASHLPDIPWVKVPVGPHGARWSTLAPQRQVLIVVHSVTAMNRLADILSIFDSDRRVQLTFTFPNASAVRSDIEHRLRQDGAVIVPWPQAINTEFDLAISVHHSGDLHEINAPLAMLSHGMGYTKYSKAGKPESRKAGKPESRKAGKPESRKAGKPVRVRTLPAISHA